MLIESTKWTVVGANSTGQSTHRPRDGPHVPAERALRPPSRSAAPAPEPEPNAEAKVTPPRASTPFPIAGMQPSSLGRVSLKPLNGSRLEQVPSVDLTAFSASTSHRPSRPANRIHARRFLPSHLTSLSRNGGQTHDIVLPFSHDHTVKVIHSTHQPFPTSILPRHTHFLR
ncbi:hypothetical protein EDC04DRAFT_1141153 [Pisolithus marmoratus]|nr:hypothetical protein EDC04DRAFT_1141153 [Pisolithus marmoratus]